MRIPTEKLRTLLRLPALLWAAALALAVGALASAVVRSATVAHADRVANEDVVERTGQPVTRVTFWITDVAGTHLVLWVTVIAVVLLAALRHWRGAAALAIVVPATQGVVDLLKAAIERPRPDHALVEAAGSSFPSAHSATAVALYATLGLIAARGLHGPIRVAAVSLAALLVLAVGMSRIYLGAHYPTDVLAGWLTGATLVVVCWSLLSGMERTNTRLPT